MSDVHVYDIDTSHIRIIGFTSAWLPLSTPEILTGLEPRMENPYPALPLFTLTQRGASQLFAAQKVGSGPYMIKLTI